MALEAKVLTFTANTTTGNQDLTGTTFTPKAAIVWGSGIPNAVDTFNNAYTVHYGFTDGIEVRCCNFVSQDNVGTSNAESHKSNFSLIHVGNETSVGTYKASAYFVQWNSDGMRIDWGVAPTTAFKFHVLFLGGTDITNTKVSDFLWDRTAGTKSVTGVGFQPDLVILVDSKTGMPFTNTPHGVIGIGAASSSTAANQWTVSLDVEDARTVADTWQGQQSNKFITQFAHDTGAYGAATFIQGTLSAFTSDGFDVSVTTGGTDQVSDNNTWCYLAIKGGEYSVGTLTEPGSTGNQTTTVSKDVKAVMLAGIGTATTNSGVVHAKLSVGAANSSSDQAVAYVGDLDAADPTVTVSRYETTSCYVMATPAATATSSTIDEEATLVSVSSTNFILNWTNIGSALPVHYITFGGAVTTQNFPVTISEPSVSISETLARIQNRRFTLSETSITTNESLTKSSIRPKIISETAVSVSEILAKIQTSIFTLTESTISVNQTIARILSAIRTNTESTISVNQTLTRVQTLIKTISDSPTISVSETLTKSKTFVKTITTEAAVTVSESLARIQNLIKTIAEPAVSRSEALTKIVSYIKAITTEPSVSVNQTLTATRSFLKSITNEAAISVSETLQRLFAATRPITGVTTTTSDSITKIQSLIKQISESTINVSDSLQGSLLYIISVIESRIKWYYSLLTRKN